MEKTAYVSTLANCTSYEIIRSRLRTYQNTAGSCTWFFFLRFHDTLIPFLMMTLRRRECGIATTLISIIQVYTSVAPVAL